MKRQYFYVYIYRERATGVPFYVGKGKDDRCNSHLKRAKNGELDPLSCRIRMLGFETGLEIIEFASDLEEHAALCLEMDLIAKFGRVNRDTGTLLNRTAGGEGISGGLDMFGYKIGKTLAQAITCMVHEGRLVQDMSEELRAFHDENRLNCKDVETRVIPHIREMGIVGRHQGKGKTSGPKSPKGPPFGWQFSLDRKMIDVNDPVDGGDLADNTRGFLKVHGDLPHNEGVVSPAPLGYEFGY